MTLDHRSLVSEIARTAHHGCGCSYDLFARLFTDAIERCAAVLPAEAAARLVALAVERGDYSHEAERDAEAFAGCCDHGIALGCCPAGCDDVDASDDDDHHGRCAEEDAFMADLIAEEERAARYDAIARRDNRVLDWIDMVRNH